MARVLVLGGGGFLGSHLARRLAAAGDWVRCVDLQRPRHTPSPAHEFVIGDLRDPKLCALALADGFDEVYQLAASRGRNRAEEARESALIDLNVLEACTRFQVGRLLRALSLTDDWNQSFVEQLYRLHAASHGFGLRLARLPSIFGPEGSNGLDDGPDTTVTTLCRLVAIAETELELSSDSRKPLALLPIDECLDGLTSVMRGDSGETVSLRSYQLTMHQLALLLAEIAGKTLTMRGPACSKGSSAADRPGARLGWNTSLKKALASTYQWIDQHGGSVREPAPNVARAHGRSVGDDCLLGRVREAVRGRDLIDWADTDFRSLAADLDAKLLPPGAGDPSLAGMKDGSIYVSGLGDMIRKHARRRTTHVLLARLDENWGAFSNHVPDRTWADQRVIAKGCTSDELQRYLDDPSVRAVVTTQHTAFSHPAILSIPIGIHHPQRLLDHLAQGDGEKSQELLISNSGWAFRSEINQRVSENFGGQLRNTYGLPIPDFYRAVLRSKFVLCPPGWGWDSHRLWETLILGSIPVLEHSEGWHKVLDDLPAVWVRSFDEVTPTLLASAWKETHARCDRFDFAKLTKQWWTSRIKRLLAAPASSRGSLQAGGSSSLTGTSSPEA